MSKALDPIEEQKIQRLVEARALMGMTVRQAAFYAGYSPEAAKRILENNEVAISEMKALEEGLATKYEVTKERVVRGMIDAIDRAKVLGMPAAEMNGWKELGKMQGLYAPSEHHVHISKDAARFERELQELPHSELLRIASSSGNWRSSSVPDIIEGEFSEVRSEKD